MLERVLIPLDSSKNAERVLPFVRFLAGRMGQPAVLVLVTPEPGDLRPVSSALDVTLANLAEARRKRAQEYLNDVCARLQTEGLWATAVVAEGPPAATILATAKAENAGLIAMATHGRVGPERWFLGSVADRVVRSSTVPVLLLRPHEGSAEVKPALTEIIVPLDGSPLAEAALPYATHIARACDVPIVLLRAQPPVWTAGEAISPEVLEALEEEARSYLRDVAERVRADGVTVRAAFSPLHSAVDAIEQLARERPGALIVMNTHGRSGLGRTLLGSVTDRVVRSATAPVLVVCSGEEPA